MSASDRAVQWATRAAQAASDKLATDIVALDVSDRVGITDIFLICSASNDRQVRAVVDAIEASLDEIDVDPLRCEGEQEGRWVLLDYGDFVAHVQHEEEREYYQLPRLWRDCPTIALPYDDGAAAVSEDGGGSGS
jgi:ribosome-associated protein